MPDSILEVYGLPVNAEGEVVATLGTGGRTVTGILPTNATPVNAVGQMVINLEGVGGSSQVNISLSQNIDVTLSGKTLVSTSAVPITLTVLSDSAGSFVDNANFSILQLGAGAVTVAAGVGATIRIRAGFPAQVQYDTVYLTRIGANEWVME